MTTFFQLADVLLKPDNHRLERMIELPSRAHARTPQSALLLNPVAHLPPTSSRPTPTAANDNLPPLANIG